MISLDSGMLLHAVCCTEHAVFAPDTGGEVAVLFMELLPPAMWRFRKRVKGFWKFCFCIQAVNMKHGNGIAFLCRTGHPSHIHECIPRVYKVPQLYARHTWSASRAYV